MTPCSRLFLPDSKSLNSEQLIDYFAKNAEFIDASGQRWNREELSKGFDALFRSLCEEKLKLPR